MPREQQRLHAAAGAQVESARCRAANRQSRERFAGRHRAKNDIGVRRGDIAGDQQAVRRPDHAQRAHQRIGDLDKAKVLEIRKADRAKRRGDQSPLYRQAEAE